MISLAESLHVYRGAFSNAISGAVLLQSPEFNAAGPEKYKEARK
jgi:hypothetical protein|tara:strand:- start:597 stop:728 length:132 start_codon:yes stop_codon:yes gene_type:complete